MSHPTLIRHQREMPQPTAKAIEIAAFVPAEARGFAESESNLTGNPST
ncbi:hypothetical protein OG418_02730 [Streptomyces phaeochromogenes]|uniref:Uncharacterized protein n=1 Tax=Streptomyces phaeochromogenes TaxID=1923 RepID=A0ABZ1HTD7_STRPH|nr:hypothetical protein [Streptomyces phaeochromogenes]WRZ35660.1 hypothetical protein OG931_51985 [Streptomyces phaeochromogenes]WSD20883.1 hypothetical protein OHB35_50825 [Streptomyces phaeochromogenes]WSJ02429.1 hypothetical protein OG437_01575 [Streptomyces phaeochromogenes]